MITSLKVSPGSEVNITQEVNIDNCKHYSFRGSLLTNRSVKAFLVRRRQLGGLLNKEIQYKLK